MTFYIREFLSVKHSLGIMVENKFSFVTEWLIEEFGWNVHQEPVVHLLLCKKYVILQPMKIFGTQQINIFHDFMCLEESL